MIGIYKITSPNGKIYIGQTIDHIRRFKHYKNLKCEEQPRLYNSLVKYGAENHKFYFIFECIKEELTKWERHFQELYNSTGKSGLNCILVKTDTFSGGHSEESKRKISESLSGRTLTTIHKGRIAKANKTRVYSDETRKKMSDANKGKKASKETREKQSLARTGHKKSQETKNKISESSKARCTNEWKQNISNKLKGRIITPEWREKLRIAALNRKNKDN